MRIQQWRGSCFLAITGLLFLTSSSWCCTIFEFQDSGFAANAIHLLHAVPIFDGNNGTFFLDNSKFAYKCEEGGGALRIHSTKMHAV
jgi:hypothetical protein